jgi:predicted SAM-dependent methyltransferase
MGFGLKCDPLTFDVIPSRRLLYCARNEYDRGLNIGAGSQGISSSGPNIRIDNHSQYQVDNFYDVVFDLTEPWPVAPGSYDIIWGFHVLEHIPLLKVPTVLREAHKALSTLGMLIIEVPNGLEIAREYVSGNWGMMENIMGEDHYPGNQHRWHYSGPDLVVLFHLAGFERTFTRASTSYHAEQQACIRVEGVRHDKHWSQTD